MSLFNPALMVRMCIPCRRLEGLAQLMKTGSPFPKACTLLPITVMGRPSCPVVLQTAWCEDGLGIRVEVSGKAKPVVGDANSPLLADGVSLWLNTRGKASGKRAGAYCYLLHLLPTGGGNERQNPVFLHGKIPRAQAEPHPVGTGQVFFHSCLTPDGYTVSLLIPQGPLTGLDFSENRMLSLLVKIQDSERGPLLSCADIEVNYDEDPNWWDKLQLVDETPPPEKGSVTPQKRQGPDDQAADRPLRKRGRGAIRKAGEDG